MTKAVGLHITLHFHFRLKLGWFQRNFDNSPAYITTFKESETVSTTSERSEICKYYFIELFYSDLDLEDDRAATNVLSFDFILSKCMAITAKC